MNRWTIFYSFHDSPIHLHFIQKSNPEAHIIPLNIKNEYTQHFAWRNSDGLVRNKIKEYIDDIKTNNIAIAEYDVLINEELPDIHIDSVYCKNIKDPEKHQRWHWFKEQSRLNHLSKYALGLFPMGFIMMNLDHAKIWIDKQYDHLYDQNIFCELRLGTIFNHAKSSMKEYNYPNVLTRVALSSQKLSEQDLISRQNSKIYHPVKNFYES